MKQTVVHGMDTLLLAVAGMAVAAAPTVDTINTGKSALI